mgnify:FL=1
MKTFYYVHTGHRIGLDRFRRATTILRALGDDDITLLSSDFRISHIGRDFGVRDCVGIDVVRNIPQIAHHGDKLIFDSDEANPIMLDDMRKFFSTFIRISDRKDYKKEENEILFSPYLKGEGIYNGVAIDDKYFGDFEKTTPLSFFFGDDDYEKDLEKHLDILEDLNPSLQLGFYYFLDYEEILKNKFSHCFEFEDYDEMITSSEILITSSPQAVLESLASGGKPIYLQRDNYENNFNELFAEFNIPIIQNYNKNEISVIFNTINNINYHKIKKNSNDYTHFLKEYLNS